ncbi:hypothetical protein J3P96_07690 [Pseudomonas sp. R3-56]|uniref:hypothetical protein n=1 Tax=Pseudomonas sp. R3-56 TaxID=2817401 RepID=UPI003DAA0C4C
MVSNSRADIVAKMKEYSVTQGWGAVCAFNRERLNRVLQQQWLEKYDGTNYLPVFSGRMDLNDSKTEYGELKNIMLGKPLLSFEPADISNSRATLTLSLLGGNFAAYEDTYGLMYEFDISEAHGYTLTVELDLSLVVGEVDRLGRVTLDLSKGVKFSCNLAGPVASRVKIGAYFDAAFKQLPPERQVYVLGILDLNGRSDLTPTSFMVLTQRAPGAELAGAANAPDGAVVVMVQLKGDEMGGDIPSPERFPYLIPDGDFSATMVLAEKYVARSDDDKLELIQSLLFPGEQNVFVEVSREEPKDLVIFGRLDPSRTSMTIVPEVQVVKAGGQPVQYQAFLNGAPVSVSWTVKSLNSNTSAGTINDNGLYQPVSRETLGRELVRNFVTASYVDPETQQSHEVRALLLVTTRAMAISPEAAARIEGNQTKTVTFVASALSGSKLTWKQPIYGSLVVQDDTAIYTPPPASKLLNLPEFTVVDPIVVEDGTGESVTASVVLTRAAPTLGIEPRFVGGVGRSATLTFTENSPAPVGIERIWTVIGDGTVDEKGVYTAPVATARSFDVVRCEIYAAGTLFFAGYSIVKLAAHQEEPGWESLTKFHLTTLGSEAMFSNGYQQVQLEAFIETDGARLTSDEEASLKIYHVNSNQMVPELPALQEGIVGGDAPLPDMLWAQTRTANRFKPYADLNALSPGKRAESSRVSVYMLSRATSEVTRFYASFESSQGVPYRSDKLSPEVGIVTLKPVPPPTPTIDHYEIRRKRVEGGGGSDSEGDDDFDLYLNTTDYWDLSYMREGRVGVNFQAAEVRGKYLSMVQWESQVNNETMFSYTGYGYNHPLKKDDENVMRYDPLLIDKLAQQPKPEMVQGQSLDEGGFRVGLFRRDHYANVRRDAHEPLHVMEKTPLEVYLTDNEGNHHALSIGFRAGDRNRLHVSLGSRKN